MIGSRALRSPAGWTIGGLSALDVAVAIVFGGLAVALASGALGNAHPKVSAAALIGVLFMIAPVAWRSRAPVAVAAVLAVVTLLNGLIFGQLIRCGATLPVFFLVAFAIGMKRDRSRAAAGLALCAAAAIAEGLYDPQIRSSGLVFVLPVLAGFFGVGRLVRARTRTAQALRHQSAELRRQREQTAQLAVLADRARVSADLEATLHAQLGDIAAAAAAGLDSLGAGAGTRDVDPAGAQQALASIEHDGRAVLGQLREVLGALHEPAPSEPPPTLARLSELLTRATSADARLSVEGSPRTLPAGLELSGYRIVEHLLLALDDAPGAAVDVRLRFRPDALELHVRGPQSPTADLQAALAAARERAGLHGGTVESRLEGRVRHATATIPLVSSY